MGGAEKARHSENGKGIDMAKTRLFLGLIFLTVMHFMVIPARADETQLISPRLKALAAAVSAGDRAAADRFWRDVTRTGTPLLEPAPDGRKNSMLVTFLWRSSDAEKESGVSVFGSFRHNITDGIIVDGWGCSVPKPLFRLGASNIWYRSYIMSSQGRFSYYFAANAARNSQGSAPNPCHDGRGLPDPANPNTYPALASLVGGAEVGVASYAQGPDAPATPFLDKRPAVARGKIDTTEFKSKILSNRRELSVYTPPGYDPKGPAYGFVLLFDGRAYRISTHAPTMLDNMLADGAIPPLVVIFVDSGERRNEELQPNPEFQAFISDEIMPWVRARYNITSDASRAVVGGASYGGLAASFTGFSHPEIFGNVLSQSGSYWWWPTGYKNTNVVSADIGWLIEKYEARDRLPLRFYMEVGTWENLPMISPNRGLRDLLRRKGNEVTYEEHVGGHDLVNWRDSLPRGLIALVGTAKGRQMITFPDSPGHGN